MPNITDLLTAEIIARSLDYLPYDEIVNCYSVSTTFFKSRCYIQDIVFIHDPGYEAIKQIVATFLSLSNSVLNFDVYTSDPIQLAEIALVFGKTLRRLRVRTDCLSYLKVFPRLQHATLYVSDLSRTHELKNLPSKPTINLIPNDGLEIEHPETLAAIPNLVALNLSSTKLPNLYFLSRLPALKEIHLSCLLENLPLSPLSICTQLTELNVAGRDDDDISWISTLVNLTRLSLRHWHALSDLTHLGHLSKLEFLDLCQCHQISDIGPLRSCLNLSELNLRSTAVTDISAIIDCCLRLKNLDLRDTPERNALGFVRQCAHLPNLKIVLLGKRRVCESDSDASDFNSDTGQTEEALSEVDDNLAEHDGDEDGDFVSQFVF